MKRFVFSKLGIILSGLLLIFFAGIVWFLGHPKKINNVLLISIDTCRPDYLSCYGYPVKTTPNIDALAAESILFENAVSPIPQTLPGHSTMLTGTIPPYHGVHDNDGYKLGASALSIAEILQQNGFTTGGIISSFILDSQFGMDQGFDSYNDDRFGEIIGDPSIAARRGDETTYLALDWLEKHKDEKTFLFLHYYDPHYSYDPPEPFASDYSKNKYAGEIAFTDYCIGQVINKLKDLGRYDSTLIIITSDHGEMLGEHGEDTHAYFIYQSALKVPLIIKLPGQTKPKRVYSLVGLIDIVPTICSVLGLDISLEIQGKDLTPYFKRKPALEKDRVFYCESLYPTKYNGNSLLGVISQRWKYIQTTRPELYDLLIDPGENNNLIEQKSQQGRILQEQLRQILEQTTNKTISDNKIDLSQESRKRLESLGYVASQKVSEDFEFDQTKKDPKDLIGFHVLVAQLFPLVDQERYDEATAICETLISQMPQFYDSYFYMGKIALVQNDPNTAVIHFKKAISLAPEIPKVNEGMARALFLQHKNDEAIKYLEKSLKIMPYQFAVLEQLALVYYQQKEYDQALIYGNKALEIRPDAFSMLNHMAWLKATCKKDKYYDPTGAIDLAKRACELTSYENISSLDTLAVAYAATGNFSEAIKTGEKALALIKSSVPEEVTEEIKGHLELYKSGKPYRE